MLIDSDNQSADLICIDTENTLIDNKAYIDDILTHKSHDLKHKTKSI